MTDAQRIAVRRIGKLVMFCAYGALGWLLGSVAWAIVKIPQEIDQATTTYLCVESWKMDLHPEQCEPIIAGEE